MRDRPFDLLVAVNPVWECASLVDRLPAGPVRWGATEVADGGGSALNTACALSAAGRHVLAVGRVGETSFDIKNSPLSLFLYKSLPPEEIRRLLVAAREMFGTGAASSTYRPRTRASGTPRSRP